MERQQRTGQVPCVGPYLERQGLLVRDMENSYLTLESRNDAEMDDLMGHSITYRIATGPHQGQKAVTLQTRAPRGEHGVDSDVARRGNEEVTTGRVT